MNHFSYGKYTLLGLLALSLCVGMTGQATAAIIVSGDSNIINPLHVGYDINNPLHYDAGNQRFFQNIRNGGRALIHGGFIYPSVVTLNTFYNDANPGSSSILSGPVTIGALAGTSLFVSVLHTAAYTPNEITVLRDYIRLGGTVFFIGEYSAFSAQDAIINAALTDLGSSLQIIPSLLDLNHTGGTFITAPGDGGIILPGVLTTGVNTFTYAATSQVSGGTPVFLTRDNGHVPFIAFEGTFNVPEPTSLTIFGLMAVGGVFYGWRRRK